MVVPTSKRLSRFFYSAHVITIIAAMGFIASGYLTSWAETKVKKQFNMKVIVTGNVIIYYYVFAGLLICSVFFGFSAQRKANKPCLWIMYCILTAILAFMELAVGLGVIGKVGNHKFIRDQLRSQMDDYTKDNQILENWDNLQIDSHCCGVDSYEDWQDFQYGRFSLKVPTSCCLPERREDHFCGQNMLPDHEHANEFIYTQGCLGAEMPSVDFFLTVMGVFGLTISVLQIGLVCFSCFLVISKRV